MEITKTNEPDSNELNEFQLKVLADAEEALEKMEKEHASKKYLIDIKKNEIEKLSSYILNDAPWKFTECLGIKEVEKDLEYDGSVRDNVTRYLVDALFQKDDYQIKNIASGIKYKFFPFPYHSTPINTL